jgi:hypothetical protein
MFDMFRIGRAGMVAWKDYFARFGFKYLKGYAKELVEAVLKLPRWDTPLSSSKSRFRMEAG